MPQQTGKIIILAGLCIVAIGLIWYFLGNKLNWIGRLPGDIRIERENFRFYFPVTTMILVSLIGSMVISLLKRLL
jgi:hypothetical protein